MISDAVESAGFFLTLLILAAGVLAAFAWAFMLTVGVVHGEWLTGMPTIGYWGSVKVSAFLLALGAGTWGVRYTNG